MPTLDERRTKQDQATASGSRMPRGEAHGHDHADHAHDHHDHHHGHDGHHHHGHDNDHDHAHDEDHDHGGHDHEHAFGWLQGVQIAVAFACSALLWFGEYTFFTPGSIWSQIHNFADSIDLPSVRDLPLGDF